MKETQCEKPRNSPTAEMNDRSAGVRIGKIKKTLADAAGTDDGPAFFRRLRSVRQHVSLTDVDSSERSLMRKHCNGARV